MGTRQSMVHDFNTKPSKQILLISSRAGGLGLTPNWNPAIDLQAQNLSFRYGQRRHVTVFRLLAAGSLEELVYRRSISSRTQKNTGELFGIGNLLKDRLIKVFASNIIESEDVKLEIKADFAIKEVASNKKHLRVEKAFSKLGITVTKTSMV